MMSVRAIVYNSAFLSAAMIFARGAIVLTGILVAQTLGLHAFALFSFVHLTATALSNIAMLGMLSGIPKFFAQMTVDDSANALTRSILAIALVIGGLSAATAIAGAVPSQLIGIPEPEHKILLLALTFTVGLNSLLIGANNGFDFYGRIALGSFALGVVLILGTGLAVLVDGASRSPLIVYLIATLVSTSILAPPIIRYLRVRILQQTPKFNGFNIRATISLSGQLFIASVLLNTGMWLAGRRLLDVDGGTKEFAEFALGLQWFGLAMMASNVIARTIMPRLTRSIFHQDIIDSRRTMRLGIILAVGGSVLVFGAVAILSPLILQFYGPELAGAGKPLLYLVAASVFAAPVSVLSSALVAAERYAGVVIATAIWWAALVAAAFWSSGFGVAAVSVSVIVSYAIYLFVISLFYRTWVVRQ